jgi:hypothetical protein
MARLVLNEANVFYKQKRTEGSMQSIRNAVFGCVLAAGVPSAFAYSNAGDNASFVQAHAWTKFAAPLAAKLK